MSQESMNPGKVSQTPPRCRNLRDFHVPLPSSSLVPWGLLGSPILFVSQVETGLVQLDRSGATNPHDGFLCRSGCLRRGECISGVAQRSNSAFM